MPVIVIGFDEGKNKVPVSPKDETDASLENKVDKVEGKGLSTEDYTTEEKAAVATIGNKQNQHINTTATLLAASWSNKTQTVSVTGVTADNTVIVSPDPASFLVYGASGVYCSAQAANSLTFTCNNVPSSNLTVNVVILGV